MKKILILSCVIAIGCGGMIESSIGSISLSLPTGWVNGIGSSSNKVVTVILTPRNPSDTLATIIPDIEKMVENPASYTNPDGSLGFTGVYKIPYNQVFVRTKNFAMTGRDLEIEKTRIEETDTQSNVDPLEVAKINVREMALMLEEATVLGIMPKKEDVDSEMKSSFEQAKKAGMDEAQFLANWGINRDEFRYIIVQKLAYMNALSKATSSAKSDSEFSTLATKLKNDLMKTMDHEINEITPEKVDIVAKELDGAFAIVISFGDQATGKSVASSLKLKEKISTFEIYNFSNSD